MATFELSDGARIARVNVHDETDVIELAMAFGLEAGSYIESDDPTGPVADAELEDEQAEHQASLANGDFV